MDRYVVVILKKLSLSANSLYCRKKGLILLDAFLCTKLKVYWPSRRNCFVNARQLDFEEAFTIFHPSRHFSTWPRGL